MAGSTAAPTKTIGPPFSCISVYALYTRLVLVRLTPAQTGSIPGPCRVVPCRELESKAVKEPILVWTTTRRERSTRLEPYWGGRGEPSKTSLIAVRASDHLRGEPSLCDVLTQKVSRGSGRKGGPRHPHMEGPVGHTFRGRPASRTECVNLVFIINGEARS